MKPVAICAMCSQSNAAVRWTVESGGFDFFELGYDCSYPNGTVVVTTEVIDKFASHSMYLGIPMQMIILKVN